MRLRLQAIVRVEGYNDFIDVTGGSNPNTSGTGSYSAAGGFDNVSGIGMPRGLPIANDTCTLPALRRR